MEKVAPLNKSRSEEKQSDHCGAWISLSKDNGCDCTNFLSIKTHTKENQKKPSTVWVSVNNSSAYLITMYRSNKNFSNIQQFKVEVNLWSHSFPFDSEGQTDFSAYKNNSNFTTQVMLYYPKLSTICYQGTQDYCTNSLRGTEGTAI